MNEELDGLDFEVVNALAMGSRFPVSGARGSGRWLALLLGLFLALAPTLEAIPTRGAADYLEIPRGIATRTWSGGKVQALTWDPRGRLVKVVQTGVEPFVWTALYDGLDRRIQTTYTPQGGATVVTKSVFDPEVEFLELGLTTEGTEDTEVSWKVYGPDLSGRYGGLQGLGGLEAVIGSDGVTRGMVSDWFGNTVGHVAAPGGAMSWSAAQFLAWGAAPGWSTPPQDGTKPLHELLGYRGLTVDPTGYVQQGLRAYDPQVGRWLSPDPVGHAASLSLYDYCDNDPLNVFDPDGRFGKGVSSGWSGSMSSSSPRSSAFSTGLSVGAAFSGGLSGLGQGVQNVSGYSSYQSHLSMFDGDQYSAANAAWNPAYMAMRGFSEAGGGTGMQPHNLGQTLSAGQRVWSGVEGGLGAVGTVGLGASAASRAGSMAVTAAKTTPQLALPGLSGAADDIVVLGRQVDTAVAKNWPGHKVLDIQNWTIPRNDSFMQSVIQNRQKVYLGSPQTRATLWDAKNSRPTVFSRELDQLKAGGYTQQGDYMLPPSN